jgi:hypothetical protein
MATQIQGHVLEFVAKQYFWGIGEAHSSVWRGRFVTHQSVTRYWNSQFHANCCGIDARLSAESPADQQGLIPSYIGTRTGRTDQKLEAAHHAFVTLALKLALEWGQ